MNSTGVRLDRGIWRSALGPATYFGRIITETSVVDGWIDINGTALWECHHRHEGAEEAYQCAEDELMGRGLAIELQ